MPGRDDLVTAAKLIAILTAHRAGHDMPQARQKRSRDGSDASRRLDLINARARLTRYSSSGLTPSIGQRRSESIGEVASRGLRKGAFALNQRWHRRARPPPIELIGRRKSLRLCLRHVHRELKEKECISTHHADMPY
jgi:hypothetical protein